MANLEAMATFPVEGNPDWSVITKNSVWVTSGRRNHVTQLIPATNKVGIVADVELPCSGLAEGFGAIWSPSCGGHKIVRLDEKTGKTVAEIPGDPANSEGGITTGAGSVWVAIKPSSLIRIDPIKNSIAATIELPSGSQNAMFANGFVWVTSYGHDSLLKIDPASNAIVATISIGPKPRFLTFGAGSVWTLNQGDGTVSRVDAKSDKLLATISLGIPGPGGDMAFGAGSVWATIHSFPLTQINPKTNKVLKQWGGPGGDGMRFGFGSVFLSNGSLATVSRISPKQK
jgi:virginiamycin B lyase